MNAALNKASVNGEIRPLSEVQIAITHPVFMSSFGVYESIQVDQGRPFHLHDHLERLTHSANLLAMPWPYSLATLAEWAESLIQALATQTYTMQILAFGPETAQSQPKVVFLAKPLPTYPAQNYVSGASAITYEGQRYLPQCKSMNTLVNHLARVAAQQAGVQEALLTYKGLLFEGARSNLFAVVAGKGLMTARTETVLSGVTRDLVVNIMADSNQPVREGDINLTDPITELFITSTSMHVMPITQLNGKPVGNGQVGPITEAASSRFELYYQAFMETAA